MLKITKIWYCNVMILRGHSVSLRSFGAVEVFFFFNPKVCFFWTYVKWLVCSENVAQLIHGSEWGRLAQPCEYTLKHWELVPCLKNCPISFASGKQIWEKYAQNSSVSFFLHFLALWGRRESRRRWRSMGRLSDYTARLLGGKVCHWMRGRALQQQNVPVQQTLPG